MAAESYDSDLESNFLTHLDGELGNYLFAVFGDEAPEESLRPIPTLDGFEGLIREHRLVVEPETTSSTAELEKRSEEAGETDTATMLLDPTAPVTWKEIPPVPDTIDTAVEPPAPDTRTPLTNCHLMANVLAEQVIRMSPYRRMTAYHNGQLTRHQLSIWAARFPEEVPTINGELEWIALTLGDLD